MGRGLTQEITGADHGTGIDAGNNRSRPWDGD
jgi:hypothetical protein